MRVLLADDHVLMRTGLANLIVSASMNEIVAEADNGKEAVALAKQLRPDLILMDISMPGLNGIEATRQILEHDPDVKVIGLSVHSDRRFAEKMIAAGAMGFLRKDCGVDELQAAFSAVSAGGYYVSPSILGPNLSLRQLIRSAQAQEEGPKLSPREQEILQLVAMGKSTREVAEAVNLSAKSIERYRQNIMEKLNLESLAALVKYAIDEGYLPE